MSVHPSKTYGKIFFCVALIVPMLVLVARRPERAFRTLSVSSGPSDGATHEPADGGHFSEQPDLFAEQPPAVEVRAEDQSAELLSEDKEPSEDKEDAVETAGHGEYLPPRLAPALRHVTRPKDGSLTAPYDWKRPKMLTVLGVPEGDKLKLVLFSTGVDLIGFGRTYYFIGCQVANKTFPPMVSDLRSPNYCLVDADIPTGALITMLIRHDAKVDSAIAEPLKVRDFVFETSSSDFHKLSDDVVIHDAVRKLAHLHEIVAIKSEVRWHEGLRERPIDPEKKRFELCIMTAMRQYPHLMQQWIDFYRQVGVDQVYVYDNVAYEDLRQFESEFVQTAFWPWGRSQQQSFNHFLSLSRNRCKYVGFFDADEYTLVGGSGPDLLKRYVRKKMGTEYDQVLFPFLHMVGNGYLARPEGFLPELYVRRYIQQKKYNVGKTVLDTDARYRRHAIHFANGGRTLKNTSFELYPTTFDHNGMMVHYSKRSWEEYILKQKTGGASVVTNAKPPKNLKMESVPRYYRTNESTLEYLFFRDKWRETMEMPKSGMVTLYRIAGEKKCRQQYCIACTDNRAGEEVCN